LLTVSRLTFISSLNQACELSIAQTALFT
jgi:hypothetical protein